MNIKALASGSSGNCYHISDSVTSILLDAGIPIRQIQIGTGFKLSAVSGALISHRHNDHSKSVCDLIKSGINVYALDDVFKAKEVSGYRCKVITNGIDDSGHIISQIRIGTFEIIPFDCQHDVPNLGFHIHSTVTGENLLYFTDTFYIRPIFTNLHYIMAEANYSIDAINESIEKGYIPLALKKRLVQSHMSIDTLVDMLKANDLSKVKQIYLLHLSDSNSRADEFKQQVQQIAGCEVYIC